LALPDGQGPWPAVLLITGSGQVDRNENTKKIAIDVFPQLAGYLAGRGAATLRYDKRGVGASDGDYYETGFYDHVTDATSALEFLKSQENIRPDAAFVLGHSEGAIIAARMAGTGADMAGAILLAGPARSGEEVLHWQVVKIVDGMHGFNKWLIDVLHIDVLKRQAKELEKIKRSTENAYRAQLFTKLNAKWMREFMAYDPSADMPNIHVPVLAITGSKDIQVPPEDQKRMKELIPAEFEGHIVPDVTHLLRPEPGEPSLSTYKEQAREPVDSRVLSLVGDWVLAHVPELLPA
jgi:hypothetical protein